jgi:amino acid transporter
MLTLSLAEMNSCLPFSGGSYGFSRITSNAFIAFLAGACDRINLTAAYFRVLYIFCITFVRALEASYEMEFVFWTAASLFVLVTFLRYRQYLWVYLGICLTAILGLLVIVLVATTSSSNFEENHARGLEDSSAPEILFHSFANCIPLIPLFYHGMETIPFTAIDISEVRSSPVPMSSVIPLCLRPERISRER